MKINIIDYIKKAAEDTALSLKERKHLEGVLSEYMALKPVREAELARQRSAGSYFLPLAFLTKKYMPIALIIALLLSGSVSYAAEGAVPGDFLYGVKVGVNEKVETALSVSTEAKAALEAKLAERRLEEATKLASKHKLTAETRSLLETAFAAHADVATNETAKLKGDNAGAAIDLASDFETGLSAHEALLGRVNGEGDVDDLLKIVHAKAGVVAKLRMDAENDAEVSAPSGGSLNATSGSVTAEDRAGIKKNVAAQMGGRAKVALANAQALFARVSGTLGAHAAVDVSLSISTASQFITDGDTLYTKGDFAGAFHSYQSALVTLKRLSVFLNAGEDTGIQLLLAPTLGPKPHVEGDTQTTGSGQTNESSSSHEAPKSVEIEGSDSGSVGGGVHENSNGSVNVGGNAGGSVSGGIHVGI